MNDYYNNQQSFQSPPPIPPKEGGQRVNWVAIVSFFIPIFGLLIILNDPFDDSDWLSNIGMMLNTRMVFQAEMAGGAGLSAGNRYHIDVPDYRLCFRAAHPSAARARRL